MPALSQVDIELMRHETLRHASSVYEGGNGEVFIVITKIKRTLYYNI